MEKAILNIIFTQIPDSTNTNVPSENVAIPQENTNQNSEPAKQSENDTVSKKKQTEKTIQKPKKDIVLEKKNVQVEAQIKQDTAVVLQDTTPKKAVSYTATKIDKSKFLKTKTHISHPVKKERPFAHRSIERVAYSPDWIFIILLALTFFLATIRSFYNKFFDAIFKSSISYQTSFQLFRDTNNVFQRASLIFNLIFITASGLFIFLILKQFEIFPAKSNTFLNFVLTSSGVFLFFGLKSMIYKTMGYVFRVSDLTSEYLHNLFIYGKVLGVLLLPIVICLPYIDPNFHYPLIILGALFFSIAFIMSIIRGMEISVKTNVSVLYLILYLCMLEILPLLIMLKVVINKV